MFNLLISSDVTDWETAQPMKMAAQRFKEYSGYEGVHISLTQADTLKVLEEVPALLMYEWGAEGACADVVRYGFLENIRVRHGSIQFAFRCEAHCDKRLVEEYADHLGLGGLEYSRTHWAIKDGGIPRDMVRRMTPGLYRKHRYEVVLSYAGEDEKYVKCVAEFLRRKGVELFFAPFREADLWGTDLSEEFDIVYRMEARYCVMFVSKKYAEKAWPTHERRSAMARAVQQRTRYVLPCRFDDTEVPGLPPSIHYIDLNSKTPEQLGELILQVLGQRRA